MANIAVWLRTVRGRLTVFNLALLGALFIAIGLGQYLLLRAYLQRQLEFSLRATARAVLAQQQISSAPDEAFASLAPRAAAQLVTHDTLALAIDGKGAVILPDASADDTGSAQAASLQLQPADVLARLRAGEAEINFAVDLPGASSGIAVVVPVARVGGPLEGALIVVGDIDPNRRALSGLAVITLLTLVALALIVIPGSSLAARGALQPLRRMVTTTRQIAAGDLTRRVDEIAGAPDEVSQLARSFNQMLAQLQLLFEQQQQLVADASHELRTPLTAIQGALDVLMMGGAQDNPQAAAQLLSGARREVARLTRLVNDLLQLHTAERGPRPLGPVDVLPLLQDVQQSGARLAADAGSGITVELADGSDDCGCRVLAEPDGLRQVLLNLTDNAVKFAPAGSVVTLAVRRAGNQLAISVQDHGPGIAPEHLPHIFKRFYRGDAARARQSGAMGGSGLGLAIAAQLVAAMNGELSVRSAVGQGSTFTVTLSAVD